MDALQLTSSFAWLVLNRLRARRLACLALTLQVFAAAVEADPLDTWYQRHLDPDRELRGVAFGNGRFLAVSDVGSAFSADGVTWEAGPGSPVFTEVAFGDGLFVGVGFAGSVFISGDGTVWTNRSLGGNHPLNDAAHGNGVFVGVGGDGEFRRTARSTNGVNWSFITSSIAPGLQSVVFGNGLFVAVGYNGSVLTSPDGLSWTARASGTTAELRGIAYGDGRFVAVGTAVLTSTNGFDWVNQGVSLNGNSVAYGNALFVAVSANGGIHTSPDGAVWTPRSSGTTQHLQDIAFAAEKFVAVGANNAVVTSPDGVAWTPRDSLRPARFAGAAYGTNGFVVVGQGGRILTSGDGGTWTQRSSGSTQSLLGVTHADGTYVAVGQDILTSSNTTDWVLRDTAPSFWFEAVAWGNGLFVAVGSNGLVRTSPDGVTWTPRNSSTTSWLKSVVFGNNRFAAVGLGGRIIASSDGVAWTRVDDGTLADLHDVTFGDGQFVAVGGTTVAVSSDGALWSGSTLFTLDPLVSCAFGNGVFVAAGTNGSILSSRTPSSIWSWTVHAYDAPTSIADLAFGNDTFVAAGDPGRIFQSAPVYFLEITWQSSDTTVAAGTSRSLFISLLATPPVTIQWYHEGEAVPGGTNETLWLPNIEFTAAGAYHAEVRNRVGTISSAPITLTVAPVILDGPFPVSEKAISLGGWADFSMVVESGEPYALQWQLNGVNVPGATNLTLGLRDAETAHAGAYVLVVSNAFGLHQSLPATLTVLTNWHVRNPKFDPTIPVRMPAGIAHGNGTFALADYGGGVFTSTNAVDWQLRVSEPDFSWRAVTYGSNGFVAVGNDPGLTGGILHSVDGTTWSRWVLGTNLGLDAVTFGNGTYVATGTRFQARYQAAVLTSSNGLDWVSRDAGSSPEDFELITVTFGNGMFVAAGVGGDPGVLTSPDGIVWTRRASLASTLFHGAAYGNGRFVIVGSGLDASSSYVVRTAVSTNGTNWTVQDPLPGPSPSGFDFFSGVAFGNGLFAALHSEGSLWTSTNGSTWTRSVALSFGLDEIIFAEGRFVALGERAVLQSSPVSLPASLTWMILQTPAIGQRLTSVAFDSRKFVAVGYQGTIVTSDDGAAWRLQISDTSYGLYSVAYGNGTFAAVGQVILSSTNGTNWTLRLGTPASLLDFQTVAFVNGGFMAVGGNGAMRVSADGATWTTRNSGTTATLYGVAHGNGTYVVCGAGGLIRTSPDGVNWTPRFSGVPEDLNGVTFGNGLFVIQGNAGAMLTSSNGVTWTPRVSETTEGLATSAHGYGQYVAVGMNGVALRSTNAIQWAGRPADYSTLLLGVTAGHNTFVVVGDGGTILQSDPILLPLVIVEHPQSQSIVAGESAVFAVRVTDSATLPVSFQWNWNGSSNVTQIFANALVGVADHTSTLTLSNVSTSQAGLYSVSASNAAGGVTSLPAQLTVLADSDGDHIPDGWEMSYGLKLDDPNDAASDNDQDGRSNLEEYWAGTNPTNALSVLKVQIGLSAPARDHLLLQFEAVSNKSYTLQSRTVADTGDWSNVVSFGALSSNRVESVTNSLPAGAGSRYYRLTTPAQP